MATTKFNTEMLGLSHYEHIMQNFRWHCWHKV